MQKRIIYERGIVLLLLFRHTVIAIAGEYDKYCRVIFTIRNGTDAQGKKKNKIKKPTSITISTTRLRAKRIIPWPGRTFFQQ